MHVAGGPSARTANPCLSGRVAGGGPRGCQAKHDPQAGVRGATQNGVLMIVLGIDPGIANTGFGVLEGSGSKLRLHGAGVIETPAGSPLERRLAEIHACVWDLLDEHGADAVAVEELYFGANARTAFAVGQARGVVLLAAGQRGVPSRSYTPQQVKDAVCGNGRAGKDQVGRMVARLVGLSAPPSPDHAADALAVAICDLNRASLSRALANAEAPGESIRVATGRAARRITGVRA
jgi:crossover junction endodeoxyribonuclease RuvC